jgi:hypothetical protein
MTACDHEAIRRGERHRIAALLQNERDTLVSFVTNPGKAIDLLVLLLTLDKKPGDCCSTCTTAETGASE